MAAAVTGALVVSVVMVATEEMAVVEVPFTLSAAGSVATKGC